MSMVAFTFKEKERERSQLDCNEIRPISRLIEVIREEDDGRDLTEIEILRTKNAYDTQAEKYAEEMEWTPEYEGVLRKLIGIFANHIPEGSKVLVAGCGTGKALTTLARNYGYECVGVDFSEGMLHAAEKRIDGIAPLLLMDIREFTPSVFSEPFDAIWCDSALESIPKGELPGILERFARILNPRGVIFFGLKLSEEGEVFSDNLLGEPRFFTTFTEDEVDVLIQDSPFSQLERFRQPHINAEKPEWVEIFLKRKE